LFLIEAPRVLAAWRNRGFMRLSPRRVASHDHSAHADREEVDAFWLADRSRRN
jgi:hypothetical protein